MSSRRRVAIRDMVELVRAGLATAQRVVAGSRVEDHRRGAAGAGEAMKCTGCLATQRVIRIPPSKLRRAFARWLATECRAGAQLILQTFLAIADPSGDSSEYGGSPAVASRDEVKMSIPLLSAAHESGELGVETRRVLEERRMTDALIDRELGARDHFRRVLGSDEVRVLVLGPVGH